MGARGYFPDFRTRAFLIALALCVAACSPSRREAPIVVLVSFDGWRWDYLERANTPHLRELASRGVRAEGLISTFPSKTFPAHYTLVTGLHPAHHGIISNNIADPAIEARFSLAAEAVSDPRWWGGEPVWTTAVGQGRRTAAMFWPGSDVAIGGTRPTYWRRYDSQVPDLARVEQVLDWLALPQNERPSFITLYFSAVDTAGHNFGPESAEALDAARHLDRMLGELVAGVRRLGLDDRTSFVIVSDHGMSQLSESRTIFLDDYLDLSRVDVIDWTPLLGVAPRAGTVDDLYRALRGRHPSLAIYKRADLPLRFNYRDNPRIPPILGLLDDGWRVTSRPRWDRDRAAGTVNEGDHGYDPGFKSMHGLFVAAGRRLRQGLVVPAFENVHVYELLCALLELTPRPNDGDPGVTRSFLRD
jgi:predicted AlkP superfamily pyrophosphatase or phosphodiesterase